MKYRFTKNDITYRRDNCGNHVLSIVLDGQLKKMSYMFFTKREAFKKFLEEFGTYPADYKPVGTLCLCNWGGLAIMEYEYGIDDYVIVCDNYGDGYKNITKNKIYYNLTIHTL